MKHRAMELVRAILTSEICEGQEFWDAIEILKDLLLEHGVPVTGTTEESLVQRLNEIQVRGLNVQVSEVPHLTGIFVSIGQGATFGDIIIWYSYGMNDIPDSLEYSAP